MIGIPINDVIALIGKIVSEFGKIEIISANSNTFIPIKTESGINILWFDVFDNIRDKWGTIIPIKPIGPQ